MSGPEDFDPSLSYQDTQPEQADPQVQQTDPVVRPAPAEKPDSWIHDEAMLGYAVTKAEQVSSAQFFDGAKMGLSEPEPVAKTAKLSDKVVVVCDNGRFVEYAAMLARSFGKVYYHCARNKARIGTGVKGIEVLQDDLWEVDPESVDLWVFPDVGFGYLQEELRNRGRRVWGCGMGELMDVDRADLKKEAAAQGLKVGAYVLVKGVDSLREYLKANEDVYVKTARKDGSVKTFRAKSYRVVKAQLDQIQQELGPLGAITEFIVEKAFHELAEIRLDGWAIDGKYPRNLITGVETPGGYIGAFGPVGKPGKSVASGMAPVFKKFGCRGPVGLQLFAAGPDDAYLSSVSCRLPCAHELVTNAAEIAWQGADGVVVEPVPRARFMAKLELTGARAGWQPVYFPAELREFVRLPNLVIVDDEHYVAAQGENRGIGSVVAFGDTAEAAMEMAEEYAEAVEGPGISYSEDAVEEAVEAAEEAAALGVKIF
jgi:hypothetical protein